MVCRWTATGRPQDRFGVNMSKFVTGVLLIAVPCLVLAQSKDWKKDLEDSLKASYKMTRTSKLASNQITEAGTVFVLEKEGLAADLATDATFFTSRVRNGEVSERGGASGFFSKDSTKRLDAGERVFITDIDVKDDRIRVGMLTAETSQVQVKGSTKQTRYRGYVDFEFDKTLMASMPANDALKAIEAIFVPADKVAGTKTKTLELDQTIQEVEAILGKPATVVKLGARTIYNYPSMKIVFTDGRVSDVE